jgi:hypothetical protein
LRAALALLLLGSPAAPAAAHELLAGPLRLKGAPGPMSGPSARLAVEAPPDSLLTGMDSYAADAQGRRLADQSSFCHTDLFAGPAPAPPLLSLSEGLESFRLPSGFGLAVAAPASVNSMAQGGPAEGGEVWIRTRLVWAPAAGLRPLVHHAVALVPERTGARRAPGLGGASWLVPPGRHVYELRGRWPADGRVHAAFLHAHRGAARAELRETDGGPALWTAVLGGEALDALPAYSSAEGFPVSRSRRFLLRLEYENRGEEPLVAMGTAHLFVAGHPADKPDVK